MEAARFCEKHRKKLLLSAVLLYLMLALLFLNRPLVLDELYIVIGALSVLKTGIPADFMDAYEQPLFLGHPPLLIYLTAFSLKLLGTSEAAARALPLALSLGTLLLTYFTALLAFQHSREKHLVALLAAFLYAINPLTVMSAALLDIDGSLLVFLMSLFLYLFMRTYRNMSLAKAAGLGLLLALVAWSKLQGPPLLLGTVFLFYLLQKRYREGIMFTSACGGVGAAAFALTWYAYATAFRIPLLSLLAHASSVTGGYGGVLSYLALSAWAAKNLLLWTTPALFLLVLLAAAKRIRGKAESPMHDLLLLSVLFQTALYLLLLQSAYGFPKYFITAMPAAAIVAAHYSRGVFQLRYGRRELLLLLGLAVMVLAFNLLILKDPFLPHYAFSTQQIEFPRDIGVYAANNLLGILYLLPLLLAFPFLRILLRKDGWAAVKLGSLVVIAVFGLYLSLMLAATPYLKPYFYGQAGMMEAARYVRENSAPDDTIVSRIEISYYANRRYYKSYPTPPYFQPEERFYQILSENKPKFIVLSPIERIPDFREKYELDRRFGHFTVYRIKAS